MTERVQVGGLQVAKVLFDFVNNEAIPGTGIAADQFWSGCDAVINDLAPKNRALLAKRDDFQAKIDAWHQGRAGQPGGEQPLLHHDGLGRQGADRAAQGEQQGLAQPVEDVFFHSS